MRAVATVASVSLTEVVADADEQRRAARGAGGGAASAHAAEIAAAATRHPSPRSTRPRIAGVSAAVVPGTRPERPGDEGYAPVVTDRVAEQLKRVPAKPGVYLFRDERGDVLYVGKAKSLRPRVRSYFQRGGRRRARRSRSSRRACATSR